VTTTPEVLRLQELGRRFDGDPPVDALVEVNLTVRQGEWVAIVGPSGSGKSTLLNVIGCLDTYTSGSYQFDGLEVSQLNDKQRAGLRCRGIGFVFQAFHLIGQRSVTENVMLAEVYRKEPSINRRARALAALELVGLSHRTEFLPTKLSGGERQRAAIARALVGSPRILLCDEPTGNLDSVTTDNILELFATLHEQGMTIVMITHDREVAGRAGRLVSITDGVLTDAA
jgi:macrolide transport system ATP-binding/permease protein